MGLSLLLEEGQLSTHAKQLVMLQQALPASGSALSAVYIKCHLPNAPPSWLLLPRPKRLLVGGVKLRWPVAVSDIKEAVQRSAQQQKQVDLRSDCTTPPLGGVSWQLKLLCSPSPPWQKQDVVVVGLYAEPYNMPPSMFCNYTFGGV